MIDGIRVDARDQIEPTFRVPAVREPCGSMELAGALLNRELAAQLERVWEVVAGLSSDPCPGTIEPTPAQGEVLRAIKAVLACEPDGLRTVEVWRLVVARLGRPVLYATVKAGLADHARKGGCFERLQRGVYRLV